MLFPGDQRLDPRTLHLSGQRSPETRGGGYQHDRIGADPGELDNRFRLSADYYEIEINNEIQGGQEGRVIANCYNIGQDCQYIQGTILAVSPNGFPGFLDITDTLALNYNARSYEAKGVDLAADYSIPLDNSTIMLRLMSTHSIETIVTTPPTTQGQPDTVRDISGQTGGDTGFFSDWAGSPDWVHNLVLPTRAGRSCSRRKAATSRVASSTSRRRRRIRSQAGYNPRWSAA